MRCCSRAAIRPSSSPARCPLVMLIMAGLLLLLIVAPAFRKKRDEAFQETE